MEYAILGVLVFILVFLIYTLQRPKPLPPTPIDYQQLENQIRKIVEKVLEEHKPEKFDYRGFDSYIRIVFDSLIEEHLSQPSEKENPEPIQQLVKDINPKPDLEDSFVSKVNEAFIILLDIETSGLRKYRNSDPKNLQNWPRIVQLAYQVFDAADQEIDRVSVIFKQPRPLPPDSIEIHGITDEMCKQFGVKPEPVLSKLYEYSKQATYLAGHNIEFDHDVLEANMRRFNIADDFEMELLCTMKASKELKKLRPKDINGRAKMPSLGELHDHLFGFVPQNLHNAEEDMLAVSRCFFEMKKRGLFGQM